MIHRRSSIQKLTLGALFLALPFMSDAQDGEELFRQNCASCHTVGGGKRVGPDLAGVNDRREEDWLSDFIKSSSSMIEGGDSLAQSLYDEFNQTNMPDQDLNDKEIDAVLAYIEENSPEEDAQKEATAEAEEEEKEPEPQLQGDLEKGVNLFTGYEAFENGGPSCVSCHHVKNDRIIVGGGRYAKDLTDVHERLGRAGIKGMLESPGFAEMQEAYDDAPLTDQEIAHLLAFLEKAEEERLYQSGMDMSGGFLFWGAVIGLPCFLLLIALIWVRRRKQPVEQKIFQRKGYGNPKRSGRTVLKT